MQVRITGCMRRRTTDRWDWMRQGYAQEKKTLKNRPDSAIIPAKLARASATSSLTFDHLSERACPESLPNFTGRAFLTISYFSSFLSGFTSFQYRYTSLGTSSLHTQDVRNAIWSSVAPLGTAITIQLSNARCLRNQA